MLCTLSIGIGLFVVSLAGCSAYSPEPLSRGAGRIQTFTVQDWDTLSDKPDLYKGEQADIVGRVFAPFDAQSAPQRCWLTRAVWSQPKRRCALVRDEGTELELSADVLYDATYAV